MINLPQAITYIGDTIVKEFAILDDGAAVDLANAYSNITVWLVDSSNTVRAKYSRETLAGHDTANFDQLDQTASATKGKFKINIQRAITLAATVGAYKYVLKVFAVDVDFANSQAIESFEITTEENNVLAFRELPNKSLP